MNHMLRKLDRPASALPTSYFWTWDHSTNWVLDDPGTLNFGCHNKYLKRPETFLKDYSQVVDMCADLGVAGVTIFGFLRDSHGGMDSAKRLCDYAASRGVAVMPGVGTTAYGGIYYEGDSPYNLSEFLRRCPDARRITQSGDADALDHACPTHPAMRDWFHEGIRWLFREFAIGGVNLENGDLQVCYCSRCRKERERWPADEQPFFTHQGISYNLAVDALREYLPTKLVVWATYIGFVPGMPPPGADEYAYMQGARPAMLDMLDNRSIAQWRVTSMLRQHPVALMDFLDNGQPASLYDNSQWPAEIKAPFARNVSFIYQGSQWHFNNYRAYERPERFQTRYSMAIASIKEACVRSARANCQGVSIHGEVTPRSVSYALNYLAYSHFIHWPFDSLRDFGRKTMGTVLGSPGEGEEYVEILARHESGLLTPTEKNDLAKKELALQKAVEVGRDLIPWRYWYWLNRIAQGITERHTASIF
jgi:hypothetical protein